MKVLTYSKSSLNRSFLITYIVATTNLTWSHLVGKHYLTHCKAMNYSFIHLAQCEYSNISLQKYQCVWFTDCCSSCHWGCYIGMVLHQIIFLKSEQFWILKYIWPIFPKAPGKALHSVFQAFLKFSFSLLVIKENTPFLRKLGAKETETHFWLLSVANLCALSEKCPFLKCAGPFAFCKAFTDIIGHKQAS